SGGSKVQVAGAVAVTVASSTARAEIPAAVDITTGTASTTGTLTVKSENNTDSVAIADGSAVMPTVGFDAGVTVVDLEANTLQLGTGHALATGDAVVYHAGAGGSSIGGLEEGHTYYVIDAGGGKFKLADTAAHASAGTEVNLTSRGKGSNHSITETSEPAVGFDPQRIGVVDPADDSIDLGAH